MKLKGIITMLASLLILSAAGFAVTVSASSPVISLGKPVIADSEQGANPAIHINDGATGTRWCADNLQFPHHVEMDLGGWYDVDAVDVNFYVSGTRYYFFKLYAKSTENDEYALMNDGEHNDNTTRALVKPTANAEKVRYIKVEVTGSKSDNTPWASIREWTVYGSPKAEPVANVTETESFPDRFVSYATAIEELLLPETANIKLDNDMGYFNVKLNWNTVNYNPEKEGEQLLTAEIAELPAGVANPNALGFTLKITVRPEDYKAETSSKEKISFNENWKFYEGTNSAASGSLVDDSEWQIVTLPHTWYPTLDEEASVISPDDGWYRNYLTVPSEKECGRVYLEFEASSTVTTLYVNGTAVGEPHYGGYTLFRYDITEYVIFGAENLIAVKVNSNPNNTPPIGGDFTRFGGITGNVSLIYVNNTHVTLDDHGSPGVHVTPTRDGETTTWNVWVEADITNADYAKTVTVKTVIRDLESFEPIPGIPEELTPFDESTMYGNNVYLTDTQTVSLIENADTAFEVNLTMENPRLWNGRKDPFRYALDFEIYSVENVLLDKVTQNFGFRYFRVDQNEGFYLNGEKYPLRGVGYHEDIDGKGSALTKEDWDKSFALVYKIGATGVRIVHYPHDPYSYELCDKYGIVTWTELPQISDIDTINSAADMNPVYAERTKNMFLEL